MGRGVIPRNALRPSFTSGAALQWRTMRVVGRPGVLVAALCIIAVYRPSPLLAQAGYDQFRIIAPAAPGGGWDQTARAMQVAMQNAGLARVAPVENIPGAAGTIGLARFMGAERTNDDAVLVSGLIMLGGIVMHRSQVTLHDVTPIARVSGEYEVIAVAADSPYRTLKDLLDAFVARPESISWGGGSAGGSDQMLAGMVADAVGVTPRRLNYIAFSGGGESLSAIVGGQVSAGINGLAEFAPHLEAGTLRGLAISSATRLPGVDIPTLKEQGLDIEFENWRSVVAPPGLTAAGRARIEQAIDAMVRSDAWREQLTRYRWIDRYLAGREFEAFVAAEEARVTDVLTKLGTVDDPSASLASAGPYPLFVLAGLVVFGAVSVVDIARRRVTASAVSTSAPGLGSLALIVAGAACYLGLAERAGFVLASSALFWLTARAFDNRRPLRDAVFAVGLSFATFLLFARLLQLSLPEGVLEGWL